MTPYRLVQHDDAGHATRIYQTDPTLSHVDAWCVSLAGEQQGPLITFDERQRAALTRIR